MSKLRQYAGVVELVDAPDSKSGSERSVGSIPTARTKSREELCQGWGQGQLDILTELAMG